MKKIHFFILFLIPFSLFSQNFDWLQTVGDIKSDFGSRIITDKEGNTYVMGYAQGTCNFGADTVLSASQFTFLAKYNSAGTNLWAKNTATLPIGIINDIKPTPSGGTILVGDWTINNFVRLDSAGNTAFTYEIPLPPSYGTKITSVDFDHRGNYIFAGSYSGYSPALPVFGKFQMNGSVTGGDTILWNINMYPSAQGTISISTALCTPDNGFVVIGQFSNTFTAKDIYGDSIVVNATQGLLGTDRLLLKYDSNGYLIWAKHYNDATTHSGIIYDSTSNSYYSMQLDYNNFLAYGERWDSVGEILWNTRMTYVLNPFTFLVPKLKVNNGYLYFLGGGSDFTIGTRTVGAFVLKRFTLNGALVDSTIPQLNSLIFLGDASFSGNSIILTGGYDGNMTWGNETMLNSDSLDNVFVGKIGIDSLFQSVPAGVHGPSISDVPFKLYPNPATDMLYIDYPTQDAVLTISDMTGRAVTASITAKEIDVSALPSGVYFLRIQNSNSSLVSKFVKE